MARKDHLESAGENEARGLYVTHGWSVGPPTCEGPLWQDDGRLAWRIAYDDGVQSGVVPLPFAREKDALAALEAIRPLCTSDESVESTVASLMAYGLDRVHRRMIESLGW